MSVPHLLAIQYIWAREEAARAYLVENQVLIRPERCPDCDGDMALETPDKPKIFRCKNRHCRKKRSITKETFFGSSKLALGQILMISYFWLINAKHETLQLLSGCSSRTITSWYRYLNDLVAMDLSELPGDEGQIGGDGIIVEIDESKFGKRRYNRGHRVVGVWVVGGIDRSEDKNMFAVSVPDRSARTLLEIIRRHVRPGSIIYTDCWKGYRTEDLADLGCAHLTVNHSYQWVDPRTGAHTNTIEGMWSALKAHTNKRHRTADWVDPCLMQFIWRRKYKDVMWNRLLDAMATIVYPDAAPEPDQDIGEEGDEV